MPRQARIIIPGLFYHVTQRGNNQRVIFETNEDRRQYLRWINENSSKYNLIILSYCLMNNHVHFIVKPKTVDSIAKTFSVTHQRYSYYFNKKHQLTGHLWQGRFYSCALSESHLFSAMLYVERNPLRAGLVKNPWDWPWSSAKINSGFGTTDLLLPSKTILMATEEWRNLLSHEDSPSELKTIRETTQVGGMAGDTETIKNIELKYGVKFINRKRGRPNKGREE